MKRSRTRSASRAAQLPPVLLGPLFCAACAAGARAPAAAKGAAFLAGLEAQGKWQAAPDYIQQEADAKSDFIHRCTLTMSMRERRMLPLSQVAWLCKATDHYEECQDEVARRFTTAHMLGGSMAPVCGAVYGWFQDRYGMLCPHQCGKSLCKATCQWLEASKKLATAEADLEVQRETQKRRAREALRFRRRVEARRSLAEGLRKKTAKLRAESQRANASLAQHMEEVSRAESEEAKAKNATLSKKSELEQLGKSLADAQDAAAACERKASEAALEVQLQEKRVQRIQSKLAEMAEGLKKQQQLADAAAAAVRDLKRDAEEKLKPSVEQLERQLKGPEAAVSKAKQALERAKAELEGAKANERAMLEDFVAQERAGLEAALDDLSAFKRRLNKAKMDLEHQQEEIQKAGLEKQELEQKAQEAEGRQLKLKGQLAEEEAKAKKLAPKAAEADKQLAKAKSLVSERGEELRKKQPSLQPFYDVEREREEALQKLMTKLKAARSEAMLKTLSYEEQRRRTEEAEQEQQKLSEFLLKIEQNTSKAGAEIDAGQKAQREARKRLEERKPEVVRQHGLGLLQLLGY